MRYIVTSIGNNMITITKEKRDKLVEAIEAGVKFVTVNDSYLSVSSITSILPADEYLASENRKLNGRGKWICRHGAVHDAESRCECSRDTRLCDGPNLITSAGRIECPQCHALCQSSNEFCDSCDAALVAPDVPKLAEPKGMQSLSSIVKSYAEIKNENVSKDDCTKAGQGGIIRSTSSHS